jgi:membrane fusion protein
MGVVDDIANVSVDPTTLTNVLGAQTDEAKYRVRVRLDQQTIKLANSTHYLMIGMTMDADILLEKRSFSEWLFKPLRKLAY